MNDFYRLEKLTFNNFKLFGGEFTVNFSSNDLIVFDGPNGHGKTTVYDAIELALTGGIRRLNSTENQQNPKDVVVAHNNNMDCFVRLELKSTNNSIVIERRIKNNIPNSAKKISNFKNLWDLILVSDNGSRIINQQKLNELLGNPNLDRDFTLFHYLEQEDTAHFLKHKKEKERAEALSVLFGDTIEMQEKVVKVTKVEKRLDEILKEINKEKVILENRGNLEVIETTEVSEITFLPLLEWSTSNFEWDRERIKIFSPEKRDSFLLELYNIDKLIKNREFFLNKRKHTLVTSQNHELRQFIAYSQHIDKLDNFKKQLRWTL